MTIQFKTARQVASVSVAQLSQASGVPERDIWRFEADGPGCGLTSQQIEALFTGLSTLTGQYYNVGLKARLMADDIQTVIATNNRTAQSMPGAANRGYSPWQRKW
jgi:hypothetical protein